MGSVLTRMESSNMGRCKKILGETRGAEIAEAAFVLPLVFMLLLGIYWFGRAYNIYATITHAAREGARVAVASSCATCTTGGGPNTPSTPAQIASTVTQTLQASHLDPSQINVYAPSSNFCGGLAAATACNAAASNNNITICTNVQLNPGSTGPPACGVSVSFQYPYQFVFPFISLNMQRIFLKADVQMQGEN
jgi:Flp pilus assembly protein TadG